LGIILVTKGIRFLNAGSIRIQDFCNRLPFHKIYFKQAIPLFVIDLLKTSE
jgi:hypothetical protein